MKKKKKDRKRLKQAGTTATAVVTSAALVLSPVFHRDGDLPGEAETEPVSIVEMIAPDTDLGDDGDGSETETGEEKKSIRARSRWFARLPRGIRIFAALPVWAVGSAVVSMIPGWLSLSPLLETAIMWAAMALVLFLSVIVALKAAFPEAPVKDVIKKLVSRKNRWFLLFGALTLGMLEGVFLWRFPNRVGARECLRFVGSMALLVTVTVASIKRELKRRRKEREAAKAEKAAASPEKDRRRVLAAADSVSRKR